MGDLNLSAIITTEWPATAVIFGELLLVLGDASPLGDAHSCDAMGCGSVGDHVLVRRPLVEREPAAADIIAHLAAQPDGGDAMLREMLRADPDRAVRVVDGAKVARAWVDWSYAWERVTLGGSEAATASYSRHTGGAEWSAGQAYDSDADETAARQSADAALLADGWVLAGGVTP